MIPPNEKVIATHKTVATRCMALTSGRFSIPRVIY
nr:MAG TPA: hypothetical protein [Caudoviricetes sp.]